MKKGLLMTSALVAAGMLALGDDAQAQQKPTNPVQLRVGGYMEQIIGVAFKRPSNGTLTFGTPANTQTRGGADVQQFDVTTEAEIHFIGDGRLDNGLVIRAGFEMEVTGSPGVIWDEQWLILRNGFGQLILGSEDPVASLMVSGYSTNFVTQAGSTLTYDILPWISNINPNGGGVGVQGSAASGAGIASSPMVGALFDPVLGGFDSDATKIIYVSPRLFGAQVGVSYAPDARDQLNDGVNSQSIANKGLSKKDILHNLVGVAVNYEFAIQDFKFGVAWGYERAASPDYINMDRNPSQMGYGGRIDWGGWRFIAGTKSTSNFQGGQCGGATQATLVCTGANAVTGSGLSQFQGMTGPGANGAGLAGVSSFANNTGNPAGISKTGAMWNVGLLYRFGPNALSLNYSEGHERGAIAMPGDDHATLAMLSYARTLAPGIKWAANLMYASLNDEPGPQHTSAAGGALTTSIRLDF